MESHQRSLHPEDENWLRTVRFERPDHIPMVYHINDACWHHFPQDALLEIVMDHLSLFPNFQPIELPYTPNYLPNARVDDPFTDPWGCVWETADDGILGTVTQHPLADWAAFDDYVPPDPALGDGLGCYLGDTAVSGSDKDRLKLAALRHGHTFLQLCDLRGYENLMFDMADGRPQLWQLIEMVEQFNYVLIQNELKAGAEWMCYPEDLGMQRGPMVNPEHFRTFIRPSYQRLMQPAREAGCIIHMHSDGHLHALMEDILACGVDVMNLQDLVNGLDWIAATLKDRVSIDLDVDRQEVTTCGSPADIDRLIRREVELLGSPRGGLSMIYGLYPGTPLENAQAVADAMVRYAGYHS